MESFKKLECIICNKDIEDFYNLSSAMLKENRLLMESVVKLPLAIKSLMPGRVVVLNHGVSRLVTFQDNAIHF